MSTLEVTFLGTGDAFGSGGRLPSSALVRCNGASCLVDCGASTLAALRSRGLDPGIVDTILLTHLHGDHFGGVPFFVMDAHFASARRQPLTIAGPPGLEARIRQAHEVLFPGTGRLPVRFLLRYVELCAGEVTDLGACRVTPFPAAHSAGAPCYALRLEWAGRTLAFSGDGEWSDALIEVSREADLFVCECYGYESAPPRHLDYRTLMAKRPLLTCRRLLLTHMGEDMLARRADLAVDTTEDGLVVEVERP